MELAFAAAVEQARMLRDGEVTAVELVELYLRRISQLDSQLNAFVTICAEEALSRAVEIDAGAEQGSFAGVPIAVKDLIATAGIRTTYSSSAFADNIPDFDTAVVRKLRDAGFVIVGKTNTPEFGTTAFTESDLNGATRNPWNPERTPGGSSGGAAAAVAAGLVPLAHGTDGGGSIRIPASCCGLFGLKPSRGRVSVAPFSSLEGLSTSGPISRTVRDAAALLDVVSGYELGDPWWAPPPERPFREEPGTDPGRLRIAATIEPPVETPVDPACADVLLSAAALLSELGHDVEERTPPWREPDLFDAFLTVWQVGPTLYPLEDLSSLTALNRGLAEKAYATSAAAYAQAVFRLQTYARRVVAFWSDVDVVLTPTLALPPVPIGWQAEVAGAFEQLLRSVAFTPFTAIANLTGLPAISLPFAETPDGLPLGVQAIGPPAGDALLLRLAAQVEAARPWQHRRPPIS